MRKVANWTVYKHTFPNGKVYVGITCQGIQRRWGYQGAGYHKQPIVYAAIKKYGWQNIKHEVLLTELTREEANLAEQLLIKEHDSLLHKQGYNGTPGGHSKGPISDETKIKMSESQKGRTLSEEHKEKLRQRKLGTVQPPEVVQKRVESRHGYQPTEETLQRMMLSQSNPVLQYDLQGHFIAEYSSAREAKRQTGINHIGRCCSGNLNSAGGYIWRRKKEVV